MKINIMLESYCFSLLNKRFMKLNDVYKYMGITKTKIRSRESHGRCTSSDNCIPGKCSFSTYCRRIKVGSSPKEVFTLIMVLLPDLLRARVLS
jgi:hypothetical protein